MATDGRATGGPPETSPSPEGSAEDLTTLLERALRPVYGPRAQVRSIVPLPGGASRQTYRFELVAGKRLVDLVLRRDPPGRPSEPGGMRLEADVLMAASEAGLAVPRVVAASENPEDWGTAGIVVEHVAGETIARRILRDARFAPARACLVEACGRFLGGLQAIDPAAIPGLPSGNPLADCRTVYDGTGIVSPTFEHAFRWLDAHRPPPSRPPAIVHGDFRLGNLIVDEQGLAAVIDWEGVHLGDPLEDLGWLCVRAWRYGAQPPVAGLGDHDELIAAYVEAKGRAPDPAALRWWQLFGTLRWGVICLDQATVHLDGRVRSVELAAIGRRACEQEWDLLAALAPDALAGVCTPSPASPQPPDLHGRPTADELLDATEEFLREELMVTLDGRQQFQTRVAANVIAIVRRELRGVGSTGESYQSALGVLGVSTTDDLVEGIRTGRWDDRATELARALAEHVTTRVSVANPSYLTPGV